MTLNAHTEAEAKGLIVDKALLRGDMQYESPNGELKIKGAVDLKLPCGVEPGPTVQGNALASFKVGPVDVEDAVAEVEYHCAPTVNDTRSFRVYISMPTLTIDGSGTHAELTDVEFDITGTQKPAAAGNATTVAPALGDSKNATANSVSPWTFSGYVKGDAKVTGAAGASGGVVDVQIQHRGRVVVRGRRLLVPNHRRRAHAERGDERRRVCADVRADAAVRHARFEAAVHRRERGGARGALLPSRRPRFVRRRTSRFRRWTFSAARSRSRMFW